ncbi:MAG: MBL fold metallo-hydrolase [Deltaproteobacteria bacterium]|nr:MBL fold metallo-hydrolase [Deltaproteobacteria bacterium]
MFIRQFEVTAFSVFCYLVGCKETKEAVVIDPAGDAEYILKEAAQAGYRITKIINTHAHVDHIMGNAAMKEMTQAPIIIHQEDAETMVSIHPYKLQMFNAQPSPPPDITVKDGDTVSFGNRELLIMHTPGHSPGGICLYLPGHVFTGDTLFVGGVGRTDLAGASWEQLLQSITKKLFSLPDATVVFPGHNYGFRPTSTVGEEKRTNPFLQGIA